MRRRNTLNESQNQGPGYPLGSVLTVPELGQHGLRRRDGVSGLGAGRWECENLPTVGIGGRPWSTREVSRGTRNPEDECREAGSRDGAARSSGEGE